MIENFLSISAYLGNSNRTLSCVGNSFVVFIGKLYRKLEVSENMGYLQENNWSNIRRVGEEN